MGYKRIMFITLAPPTISFEKDHSDYRLFAIRHHTLQLYGDLPYSYHLADVETILAEHDINAYEFKAAAWLHDVPEDTDITIQRICDLFGPAVAAMVWACTGEGANREEKQASILKKIPEYPPSAVIKTGDRISNVKNCIFNKNIAQLKVYVSEWDAFNAVLRPIMLQDRESSHLWVTLDESIDRAIKTIAEHERAQSSV